MKELHVTESHSADRAAKPKQKIDQTAEMKKQYVLDFFEFSTRFEEKF